MMRALCTMSGSAPSVATRTFNLLASLGFALSARPSPLTTTTSSGKVMSHRLIVGTGYWSWMESCTDTYKFGGVWSVTSLDPDDRDITVAAPHSSVDDMWQLPANWVIA